MAVPPPRPLYDRTDPAKAALRAELRARRDGFVIGIGSEARRQGEAFAARQLLPLLAGARAVSFYIAVGAELDCAPSIEAARGAGMLIALPHVVARNEPMRFLEWQADRRLEPGWSGLSQPPAEAPEVEPDIIVAPLLGFDSALWRIGQGAGFYDRAFTVHPRAKRIGLAWSAQQVTQVPRDLWDEPLHMIVTERTIFDGTDPG